MKKEAEYPKDEIWWERIYDTEKGLRFVVTSKPARDRYFLYELEDGKFVRLGSGPDPQKLKDKLIDRNILRGRGTELEEQEEEELDL